jgi:proline iminopeptidase
MDVGHGHLVYWEECGNAQGKPALVLHGGPGAGATPAWRRYFDPCRYRSILFDQRDCGRSAPHAGDTHLALEANTTPDLLADIEQLRDLRRAERWLLFGGSWDVTLGLAYAEIHANRVSEAIFFSITAGTRKELDWITRQAGRFFPRPGRNFRPESQRQIAMAILLMPTLACSPVPTLRFKPRRPRLVRIGGRCRGDPPRPETIGSL